MKDEYIRRIDALSPFTVAPDGARYREVDCDNFPVTVSLKTIKKILREIPAAEDVAEVVRCKDCKHWWKQNQLCGYEKCVSGNVCAVEAPPKHFCAYGERKSPSKFEKTKKGGSGMCEYCDGKGSAKGFLFGKPMPFNREGNETDFKDMQVYVHKGENPCLMAFDTVGRGAYVDVNYCPMCGRKLGE